MTSKNKQKNITVLIALILLLLGLCAALFVFVSNGIVSAPFSFFEMFSSGKEGSDGSLLSDFDFLKESTSQYSVIYAGEKTKDELFDIIKNASLPTEYYHESTVTRYKDGKSISENFKVFVCGDMYRLETYRNGELAFISVRNGDTVSFLDNKTGESSRIAYSENFSPETELGIPALVDVLSREDFSSLDISLYKGENENYYYVKFTEDVLSQTEEYYISATTGMVLNVLVRVGDFNEDEENVLNGYRFKTAVFDEDLFSHTGYNKESLFSLDIK